MRNKLSAFIIAAALTLTPHVALAGATCSFWTSRAGAVYVTLHADPGGDGALYVYVDGVQATWLTTKKRRFYVTNVKGAVVRGYNSNNEWHCGN